jgi:hypothetical protein
MCAARYPARISVSEASDSKPVIRTEINPAEIVTEHQLRSAGTKVHYQIEKENVKKR